MQDRFKFRVWNKGNECYFKDDDVDIFESNGEVVCGVYDGDIEDMQYFEQDEIILEQCTGLKDKNGKLIYEGDILKNHREEVGYVSFYQDTASMVILDKNGMIDDVMEKEYLNSNFEVIGNIHENFEKMEKSDE